MTFTSMHRKVYGISHLKVISGHQLPYKSESNVKKERDVSVQVRIAGVEVDTQRDRTKTIKNNGKTYDI